MSHVNMSRRFIRSARCPAGRTLIEYQDVQVPGLVLLVRDVTLKTFGLRYRDRDGVNRHHYLGSYPEMPLNFARGKAELCMEGIRCDWFPDE